MNLSIFNFALEKLSGEDFQKLEHISKVKFYLQDDRKNKVTSIYQSKTFLQKKTNLLLVLFIELCIFKSDYPKFLKKFS